MMLRAGKRIFAAFLLASILFVALGCGGGVKNKELFEQLLADSGESEPYEPYASKVYVIISQNASAELSTRARALADLITEKTKVQTVLKYDNEPIVVADGELEILIGNTERLASREAMGRLRLGEYVCRWDRENIILGGRYEQATLTAIEKFISEILHGASQYSLMSPDMHFEHREAYEVSDITLNGYDLYDYTIVYSEDGASAERDIAEALRSYISTRSGYWLDIIPDSSVSASIGKVISIGELYAGEQSKALYDSAIEKVEQGISIFGDDSYALSVAVAEFSKRLFENKNEGEVRAELSGISGFSASASEIDLCSAIVRTDGSWGDEYSSEMLDRVAALLKKYDVIIFREVDAHILETDLITSLPSGYVCKALEDGSAVIYDGLLFDKIECGCVDSVVTVTAQRKNSAEMFRFVDIGTQKMVTLSAAQTYDAVISSAESDLSGFGFACVGNGECSLKSESYSSYFYIDSATVGATEYEGEKFSGQHFAKLFLAMTLKAKYAPSFCELTNAFE